MFLDNVEELRKNIIKLVRKPTNQDIIYYDSKFIDLINVDVEKLYCDELKKYRELEKQYLEVKSKIDDYNERVNNLNLIGKMSELEYMSKIQELEIKYAKEYKEIKILENKINTYKNKIVDLKNKIEIQKAKEIEDKKGFQSQLLKSKNRLSSNIGNLKIALDINNKKIDITREKLNFERDKYNTFEETKKAIEEDNYVCQYCKSTLDKKSLKKVIKNAIKQQEIILEKIDKLKNELNILNNQKNELEDNLLSSTSELKNINFAEKQNLFAYDKKSVKVLKLEGTIFQLENEIENLEIQYEEKAKKAGPNFKRMKVKLEAYKESFLNLREIKDQKENLKLDLNIYDDVIEQAKEIKFNLKLHCQFLMTRNKLWEQNLSNLFDNKLKFKLFEEENLEIKEICIIYYNNIESKYLKPDEEKEVERMIIDKMRFIEDM